MQALYANAAGATSGNDLKSLEKNVLELSLLYYYILGLLAEVLKYSEVHLDQHESRYVKDTIDPLASRRPADSIFTLSLARDLEVRTKLQRGTERFGLDREEVLTVFNLFRETEHYKEFVLSEKLSKEREKELITALVRRVIFESEPVFQMMEEKYTPWLVDENLIKSAVLKTIKGLYNKGKLELEELTESWTEEKPFVQKLFELSSKNDDEYEEIINSHSSHWELERIARMDMIIIKMAITELLHLPLVPIKVTINEYIEMAKNFSTPKSKIFVNGILDAISKDLKKSNRIEKFGRGLIE